MTIKFDKQAVDWLSSRSWLFTLSILWKIEDLCRRRRFSFVYRSAPEVDPYTYMKVAERQQQSSVWLTVKLESLV